MKSGSMAWVKSVYNKKPEHELYDLSINPCELSNKKLNDPFLAKNLSERINEFKKANALKKKYVRSKGPQKNVPLDEELKNKLQALGYLQ